MRPGTRTLTISAGLAACLTTSAFARIGETEAELAGRYGQPVNTLKGMGVFARIYRFHGYEIMVGIIDGKSQMERFKKLDGGEISADEIVALGKVNAGDRPCGPNQRNGNVIGYLCGDILVNYDYVKRELAIANVNGISRANADIQADQKKNLNGF